MITAWVADGAADGRHTTLVDLALVDTARDDAALVDTARVGVALADIALADIALADTALVEAAVAGDDAAFAVLAGRHRRELHGHCMRMLRSSEQAEDAVQETLLRAWRFRSRFAGRASFRSWLYRIATNACLDEIRRDRSRPLRNRPAGTDLLDDAQLPASTDPGPAALVEATEAIEGAFVAIIELLPPRQRAALILCEVMRCPAQDVARVLGTSVAAVNSALQRARATLGAERPHPDRERIPRGRLAAVERELLDRYVDAVRRDNVAAVIALARADAAGTEPLRRAAVRRGGGQETVNSANSPAAACGGPVPSLSTVVPCGSKQAMP